MLRSQKLLLSLSAVIGLGLAPMSAGALTITAADLPSYSSAVDLGAASASAIGGNFMHKTVGGYDMVGVGDGYTDGEIDLGGPNGPEGIAFAFKDAQVVTELSLGALFVALQEDDVYNEQALVHVSFANGSSASYVLSVTGGTTADWTGLGTVTNVSPGNFGQGGVWSLSNPFGTDAVKSITLSPIGPDVPTSYRNNDYSFVSLTTTVVPEPGTMALMGMGLAGLAVSGRKRTH